jgi:chorismate mutase
MANPLPVDSSAAAASDAGSSTAAAAGGAPPALVSLRAEIDRIDDALHGLLMERAQIVARLARQGAKGQVPLRPGREANIIRRLLRQHSGPLPRSALARIWRELLAATTAMQGLAQGGHRITVCETDPGNAYVQCAREHFGALTPLRVHRSPAQAIGEVSAGAATVAVLPMPAEEEASAVAWWTALLHRDEPRIHVVARLPFWSPRPEGSPQVQALVVAAIAPDASSQDRSFIGIELPLAVSRARLSASLTAAGFTIVGTLMRRGTQIAHALIEVEGLVADGDPRLARITDADRPPVVLGGYAVPVGRDEGRDET